MVGEVEGGCNDLLSRSDEVERVNGKAWLLPMPQRCIGFCTTVPDARPDRWSETWTEALPWESLHASNAEARAEHGMSTWERHARAPSLRRTAYARMARVVTRAIAIFFALFSGHCIKIAIAAGGGLTTY